MLTDHVVGGRVEQRCARRQVVIRHVGPMRDHASASAAVSRQATRVVYGRVVAGRGEQDGRVRIQVGCQAATRRAHRAVHHRLVAHVVTRHEQVVGASQLFGARRRHATAAASCHGCGRGHGGRHIGAKRHVADAGRQWRQAVRVVGRVGRLGVAHARAQMRTVHVACVVVVLRCIRRIEQIA